MSVRLCAAIVAGAVMAGCGEPTPPDVQPYRILRDLEVRAGPDSSYDATARVEGGRILYLADHRLDGWAAIFPLPPSGPVYLQSRDPAIRPLETLVTAPPSAAEDQVLSALEGRCVDTRPLLVQAERGSRLSTPHASRLQWLAALEHALPLGEGVDCEAWLRLLILTVPPGGMSSFP